MPMLPLSSLLPLSFSEFYSAYNGTFADAYKLYSYFGGMPMIASLISESDKSHYLLDLYKETSLLLDSKIFLISNILLSPVIEL